MRISCDLFTHPVLWLYSQQYFAIAFEAYRPKLGKSLKKKMKRGKVNSRKFSGWGYVRKMPHFAAIFAT